MCYLCWKFAEPFLPSSPEFDLSRTELEWKKSKCQRLSHSWPPKMLANCTKWRLIIFPGQTIIIGFLVDMVACWEADHPKRKYSCGVCVHNAEAVHSGDQPKNRRVCKRAGNVSWPISVHLCLHWSHFAKICLNQGSKNGSQSVNKNDLLTHGLWILWMLENPCGISFARCSTF